MIDLNGDNFKAKEFSAIFNGGKAGRVANVTISVSKKTAADADNLPNYKLIITDSEKAEINEGFYYVDEKDERKGELMANRLLSIARVVLGADTVFPKYESYKDVMDGIFKMIKKGADDKNFSVFVTYGNLGYPSKYLKLRYFDFIEAGDVEESATRLFKKKNDLMDRIMEDAPRPATAGLENTTDDSNDDDWV